MPNPRFPARALAAVVVVSCLILSGCNFLAKLHQDGVDSNASVLVADGKAALERGDYANAAEYFRLAIEHDPRNSEARVGYAEAYLHGSGFSLGSFAGTLVDAMTNEGGGTTTLDLFDPSDWGQTDLTGVLTVLGTLVDTLDPISLGLTLGPYTSRNVTVNLTVGLAYALRAAAQAQSMSTTYTLELVEKSSTSAAALGISQAEFDLLPDPFWWIAGNPSVAVLTQLQTDVDTGVARLQVAAAESANPDIINSLLDFLTGLQTQVQP